MIDKIIFQKHLEKGEEVQYAVHKHGSQFFKPLLFVSFFGFILPWVLYSMGFKSNLFITLIVVWNVLAFLRLFYDFIDWYSDVWLFTNMSIIIVAWHGVFSNTSQRIGYEDTEGISFVIKGFWGTVLRFGDITLKMISGSHVTLTDASHPKRAELALMKHQGNYLSTKEMADASGLKAMLSQMVAHHMRKKLIIYILRNYDKLRVKERKKNKKIKINEINSHYHTDFCDSGCADCGICLS